MTISKADGIQGSKGPDDSGIGQCIGHTAGLERIDLGDPPVITHFTMHSVCPCTLAVEPCQEGCACTNPVSSAGCLCCATYGSPEQQRAAANKIVCTIRMANLLASPKSEDQDNARLSE